MLLGLLAGLAICLTIAGAAQAVTAGGDIVDDTRWTLADSPVHVISPIRVLNDSTLTIDAGVSVRFETGSYLRVGQLNVYGDNRDKGSIVALGTEAQPITFTSTSGVRTWAGIEVDSRRGPETDPVHFRHVIVEKSTGAGLLIRSNPSVLLENVTVGLNNGPGLQLENTIATITGGVFHGNIGNGILADGASPVRMSDSVLRDNDQAPFQGHPDSLLQGIVYARNGIQVVTFTAGEILQDRTWAVLRDDATAQRIEYRLAGDVTVRNESTLTLLPGVKLLMDPGVDLRVGACCTDVRDRGAIVAEGTSVDPIVFTSRTGNRDWGGIEIDGRASSVREPSSLVHVLIERSASRGLRVTSHDALRLEDVTSTQNIGAGFELVGAPGEAVRLVARANDRHGIYVQDASPRLVSPLVEGNGQMGYYFSNSQGRLVDALSVGGRYGIFSDSNANPILESVRIEGATERPARLNLVGTWSGLTLHGNAIPEIEAWAWTINSDRTLPVYTDELTGARHAYVILQDLYVRNGATLTISPGLTLKFNTWTGLYAGACCSAPTAATLIADGTPEEPIVFRSISGGSDWYGVRVDTRGRSLTSVIDHVEIRNSAGDGLEYWGPSGGSISNVTITNARTDGMYLYDTSVSVRDIDIRDSGRWGVRIGGSSAPSFTNLTTLRSGGVGIYGDSPSAPRFSDVTIERAGSLPLRTAAGTDLSGVTFRNATTKTVEFYGATVREDALVPRVVESDTGRVYDVWFRSPSFRVVDGATLTFAQNLTVRLGDGITIYAGDCCAHAPSDLGAIVARGTTEEPILFTSLSRLDRWGGFQIIGLSNQGELPSAFENVTIEQASGAGIYADQVDTLSVRNATFRFNGNGMHLAGTDGEIVDSRFMHNRGNGLLLQRARGGDWYGESTFSAPVVVRNRFNENEGYGLYSEVGSTPLVRGNTFTNNSNAGMGIGIDAFNDENTFTLNGGGVLEITGGTLTHDLEMGLLRDADTGTILPYTFTGDATISNGATLTIVPGARLAFSPGAGIVVGTCCEPSQRGAIIANGEDGIPITMRGRSSARDWDGITIQGNGAGTLPSSLSYVVIEKATTAITVADASNARLDALTIRDDTNGIRLVRSSPIIGNTTIDRIGDAGLRLESASPTLSRVVVSRTTGYGVLGDAASTPSFHESRIESSTGPAFRLGLGSDIDGLILRRNGPTFVEMHGGTLTRDATMPGLRDADTGAAIRYQMKGDVVVRDAATLTLGEGAQLVFESSQTCNWWGACTPIYFGMRFGVGNGYREEGHLVAAGSAQRPVVLSALNGQATWNGVAIYGRVDQVEPAAVLSNLKVRDSRGTGLYVQDHDGLTIRGLNASGNAAAGLHLVRSPALVEDSRFEANRQTGVLVESSPAARLDGLLATGNPTGVHLRSAGATVTDVRTTLSTVTGLALEGTPKLSLTQIAFDGNAQDVSILNAQGNATLVRPTAVGETPELIELASTTGSGAWNRLSLVSLDAQHLRANLTGGQAGFLEARLVPTFQDAEYDYRVYGSDSTLTQSDTLTTAPDAGLRFRVALNGFREARLDVVPVVSVDFAFSPEAPTTVHDVTFAPMVDVRFARVTQYEWTFGDGSNSSLASPVHRYSLRGDHFATLCVRIDASDVHPCATQRIRVVNHLPIANFSMSNPRPMFMEEVEFRDTSADPDGFVVRRGWEFGDNTANYLVPDLQQFSSDGNVPFGPGNSVVKHRYQAPGRYLLNFTIEDNLGGRVVHQREIWVRNAAERVLDTAGDLQLVLQENATLVTTVANDTATQVAGEAGALRGAIEAVADGNVTAAREELRRAMVALDIEAQMLLCIEATADAPRSSAVADCLGSALVRTGDEADEVRRELQHEIDRTEVPPPFVPDPMDIVNNPPPPPPPPPTPTPEEIVESVPTPEELVDMVPTPEELLAMVPDPSEIEPPVEELPPLPPLPPVPRVCVDDVCTTDLLAGAAPAARPGADEE